MSGGLRRACSECDKVATSEGLCNTHLALRKTGTTTKINKAFQRVIPLTQEAKESIDHEYVKDLFDRMKEQNESSNGPCLFDGG